MRRIEIVTGLVLSLLVFVPSTAMGEEADGPRPEAAQSAAVEAPAPVPSAKDGPRLRFGIAGAVVGGSASGITPAGNSVSSGVLGPGLQLDLGVQIRRDAAVFLRAEAASVIFLSGVSAYVVAEWTPLRQLSIGTGIGADHMTVFSPFAGAQPPGGNGRSLRNVWNGLSVPLVVGVQFIDAANWDEPRRKPALRLGLEFAAGVEPRSWIFGWHASLTIGFVLR